MAFGLLFTLFPLYEETVLGKADDASEDDGAKEPGGLDLQFAPPVGWTKTSPTPSVSR